jgi:signal transduction histidine kinase
VVLTLVDLTPHKAVERVRAALLAEVFHELRAPIGAIALAAHFLNADLETVRTEPERVRGLVSTIQRQAGTLLADLNDLLNRSSFATDRPTLAARAVEVGPIVEQAVWKMAMLLEQRGQRVRLALDTVPPVWVDERRIEQVLVNLLANATKYSVEDDEIVIAARVLAPGAEDAAGTVRNGDGDTAQPSAGSTDAVGATATEIRGWVRLEVEDHGPGIPAAERGRIFERFYRGTAQTDPSAPAADGAGLGLAIARRLVEAHGGRIGVEESRPHGARFWFTLPIAAE